MDEYGIILLILLLCVMCVVICRSYITTIKCALRTRLLIHAAMDKTTGVTNESEILLWRAENNFINSVITGYRSLLRFSACAIFFNIITLLILPVVTNENTWAIFSVGWSVMNATVISTFIFCLRFNTTIQTIYLKFEAITSKSVS